MRRNKNYIKIVKKRKFILLINFDHLIIDISKITINLIGQLAESPLRYALPYLLYWKQKEVNKNKLTIRQIAHIKKKR